MTSRIPMTPRVSNIPGKFEIFGMVVVVVEGLEVF
jgi:hypothetical protein